MHIIQEEGIRIINAVYAMQNEQSPSDNKSEFKSTDVVVSCRSSKDRNRDALNLTSALNRAGLLKEFKSENVLILDELETHEKAQFNPADSTLTIEIGRSHLHLYRKNGLLN
jgi:hypothetical protein